MRAGRYNKGMRVEISAKGLGISEEAGHWGDEGGEEEVKFREEKVMEMKNVVFCREGMGGRRKQGAGGEKMGERQLRAERKKAVKT